MGNVSPLNSLFEILKKLKYFWKYWNKFKVLFKTPTTSTGKIWVHERVYLKLFSEISADVRTYLFNFVPNPRIRSITEKQLIRGCLVFIVIVRKLFLNMFEPQVLCQQLTIPLKRNLRTICWNFSLKNLVCLIKLSTYITFLSDKFLCCWEEFQKLKLERKKTSCGWLM